MITPNELQIGNFLLNDNCLVKTHHLFNSDYCEVKTKQNNVIAARYELLRPIPLTEEYLLKARFELFPWGWIKDNILIRHSFSNKTHKYWIEIGNGTKINLPFVHTLQNFMILTGKELIFNL